MSLHQKWGYSDKCCLPHMWGGNRLGGITNRKLYKCNELNLSLERKRKLRHSWGWSEETRDGSVSEEQSRLERVSSGKQPRKAGKERSRVLLSRHRESPWLEAELCGSIGFCFVSLQKVQRGSEVMGFLLDTNAFQLFSNNVLQDNASLGYIEK